MTGLLGLPPGNFGSTIAPITLTANHPAGTMAGKNARRESAGQKFPRLLERA
jgi:hypothetical protein